MRSDARLLLIRKQLNKTAHKSRADKPKIFDARKVLNMKRAKKVKAKFEVESRPKRTNFSSPLLQRTFVSSKSPNKQVKVSNDGNIWITANSKKSNKQSSSKEISSTKNRLTWGPANVDSVNLEDIGLHDLMDMDSLPSAAAPFNDVQKSFSSRKSLAEELIDMQNTMVADQVAATSHQQHAQVLVRNLCPSVSKQDILELFTDVGFVRNVEMTQPGTAVIDFFTAQDASQACEAYHNRLLDGQPMKCQLIMDTDFERPSVTQRLGERLRNPVVASSSSSPLPRQRFRFNPSNVRFTVKL